MSARLEQRIARERRRQAARDSFVGRPVHSMHAEECESAQRSALEDSAGSTLQSCRSSDEDLGLEEPTAASGEAECCDVEDETGCDGNGGGVLFEEWGEDGDARPWYRRLAHASLGEKGLQESQEEAASLLSGRLGSSGAPRRSARLNMMGDKAFVTFSAFTGAAVATQVFHAATPGGMVAHMAPEPRDVLWGNVRVSSKQRTTRRVLAYAMVGLLLVFYVVPVTLISFVLSEQALDASFPALKQLAKDNFVVDATVKMMQPSGLIALMLLLPPLFLGLGCWEGTLSLSQASFAQLSRYYSFQITNVLLVTTVAGSVINCIRSIVDNPKYTFSLLGESLPQVCAFFSCYIFIKALSGLTIELCRAVAAMQQCVKRCVYPSASPRDRAADVLGLRCFEHPGWFSYGKFGAQDLLVVVLLMVYAVMAPLILVPGIAFFAIGSVVYRHQFLYVYVPVFESGGLLWPRIYRRTLFSLFIMQFTMVGMFFLKHAFYQGYAVLALSCATYLFKMQMRTMYITSSSVSHHLPMELATAVDDAMRYEHDTKPDHKKASDDALRAGLRDYLQPALWI